MVVPDIELVVKASGKHHADEVGHEQWQDKQLAAEGDRNPSQLGIRTEQLLPVLEAIIQGGQVACQQQQVKPSSEEDFLRKKAPVDRPLEEEDSAEVESSNDVIERMRGKEGQGEYHLKFLS